MIIWLVLAACGGVTLLCAAGFVVVRGWMQSRRRRRLAANSWQRVTRSIDGLGDVSIYPMTVGMRIALQQIVADKSIGPYEVYCWLITECVDEFCGQEAHRVGVELSPATIEALGEAVLEVSGLTGASQDALIKKSEPTQKLESSTESASQPDTHRTS